MPYLPDGHITERYRVEKNVLPLDEKKYPQVTPLILFIKNC